MREGCVDRLVPDDPRFEHAEGNTDSHVKTMLVGMSQFVFIENGKLALGRWQGIFFAEFDGPRERATFCEDPGGWQIDFSKSGLRIDNATPLW